MGRLAGWHTSPNELACSSVLITAFLLAAIFTRGEASIRWLGVIYYALYASLCMVVALTQSRGGLLSLLVLVCILGLLRRGLWRRSLLCFAILVVAVAITPSALGRIASSDLQTDASIGNRLVLWRNSLGLIWDHWAMGVGYFDYPQIIERWYGDGLAAGYGSAVSTWITLAAYWGVPFMLLVLASFSTLAFLGIERGLRAENFTCLGFGLAAAGYVLCGIFSTLFDDTWMLIEAIVLLVGGYGSLLIFHRSLVPRSTVGWRYTQHVGALAIAVFLCFVTDRLIRPDRRRVSISTREGLRVITVQSGGDVPRQWLRIAHPSGDSREMRAVMASLGSKSGTGLEILYCSPNERLDFKAGVDAKAIVGEVYVGSAALQLLLSEASDQSGRPLWLLNPGEAGVDWDNVIRLAASRSSRCTAVFYGSHGGIGARMCQALCIKYGVNTVTISALSIHDLLAEVGG